VLDLIYVVSNNVNNVNTSEQGTRLSPW